MGAFKLSKAECKNLLIESGHFSSLSQADFDITSPQDPVYNCIAWSCTRNDIWYWPSHEKYELDGVVYDWPYGELKDTSIDSFREFYREQGFEDTENGDHEPGFRKIAVYANEDEQCTHASHQLRDGSWTSKLGEAWDISHNTPETIEGPTYGRVAFFMKRKLE